MVPKKILNASHPQSGFLVETWLINSIIQQSQTLAGAKTPTLYHWRSHRGAEVDIIISFDGTLYPIEIKSTEMATAKDTPGIRSFHEVYPHENIAHGLIIYAGDRCYRINEYATALPWNACLP